ncbi:lysophospholipid acyltransferase family protein [Marinomonas sp. 2405UD68-3]|uniref:lysophospholipid acyltransferase family protein n=1 Tax=Marinomonas sp. 2405UD68-3 TaxID=3391835 RepID=UPI0039C92920
MASFITSALISVIKLMSHLSLPVVQKMGQIVGKSILRFDCRTKTAITKNLLFCFPEMSVEERQRITQQRFGYMGQTLSEMSHLWVKPSTDILKYITTSESDSNQDFIDALNDEGGVIILSPHLGNWEVISFYVSQYRKMTAMYRPQKDEALNQFILNARQQTGSDLAPTNRKGVMQLLKALKNENGLVGILPDQVPQQGSGVFAPFFNTPAYTMTLAHQLALKTKAKVFVSAAFQVDGGFSVRVVPVDEGFYSEDDIESATALNQTIESLIRLHPEQYQWEYKRFKLQPDGQESLYK